MLLSITSERKKPYMRSMMSRQRIATSTVLAASVAVLAACGPADSDPSASTSASTSPSQPPVVPASAYRVGVALISNGTTSVHIGDNAITFPTAVTDAVWSPDGSRIAFVDGDGNISTARPDGSSWTVLTKPVSGVVRSRPAWRSGWIEFAEKNAKGASVLKMVTSNGGGYHGWSELENGELPGFVGADGPEENNSAPSGGVTASQSELTGDFTFQHQGKSGPEVWVVDGNQREPSAAKIATGTEPALSPDGKRVAYVGTDGQIRVSTLNGKPVQVTFDAAKPSHLVWTPDGTQVAYSTPTEIWSVPALVAATAKKNPPRQVSATPGTVTYLGAPRDRVDRVTGKDAVDLAVAASKARFSTQPTFQQCECRDRAFKAVLTGTKDLSAALVAGRLASDGAPLLLTDPAALDPRTQAELKRIFGAASAGNVPMVSIVGGPAVVSPAVESAVRKLGYDVERITDTTQVALLAYTEAANADTVVVVSPDDTAVLMAALSLGNAPILYTSGSSLPDASRAYLNKIPATATVYAVGAKAVTAVNASWQGKKKGMKVQALAGTDAADAAALLGKALGEQGRFVIVNPASAGDAVGALILARLTSATLLPVSGPAALGENARSWLSISSASADHVYVVGAEASVAPDLEKTVGGLVSGPLGYAAGTNPAYQAQ